MRFIMEATAQEFDHAAEQEILLRYVADRRAKWRNVALVSFALAALSITMASTGAANPGKLFMLAGGLIAIMVLQQFNLDRTGGNPYASLKQLYRGRMMQTQEEKDAPLRLEIEETGDSIEIYNRYGKAGEWNLKNLCRVVENDDIFELSCKGLPKQYLALPKASLRTGTEEELREFFEERLGEKLHVEALAIPEKYQQELQRAKARLFGA